MASFAVDQTLRKAKSFVRQGQLAEARSLYERVLGTYPKNVRARKGLDALRSIRETNDQQQDKIEGLFTRLLKGNQFEAISERIETVLKIYPNSIPLWTVASIAYSDLKDWERADVAFHRLIELSPEDASAYNNLGRAYRRRGNLKDAIISFEKALSLDPQSDQVYSSLAQSYQEQGLLPDAIEAYGRVVSLVPEDAASQVMMWHQMDRICDWSAYETSRSACSTLGIKGHPVPPFSMLPLEDSAERQLCRTRRWAASKDVRAVRARVPLKARPAQRPDRLRIGYFSADFHNHATLFLMSGLLREHDRDRFEIHAYSYGTISDGDERMRLMEDVDLFQDVRDLSDSEIADLGRSRELDIAIDLKGYTAKGRSSLFSPRIAPVQINYLGYPGSLGVDYMDYIVADDAVIPEELRRYYDEKVLYLPDSYQPNDTQRVIAETPMTRSDLGLPEEGFVFCCFNQNYKISPREFDIWMRLLQQVEGSVLWLMRSSPWAEENLRREAWARGVDPQRLVFARMVPVAEHLARQRHADLFLDTFAVNAHTTTSDALWAGLPVVTLTGEQFAARVATSLLRAVGMDELVTSTVAEYELLALELAKNPARLENLRHNLEAGRETSPLFDTGRYTRHFEAGLDLAYDRYLKGLKPEHIVVPGKNPEITSV